MKSKSKSNEQPLEGEGSHGATRPYNQHLNEAVARGGLEAGAEHVRRAPEVPQGKELQRGSDAAKKGPKQRVTSGTSSNAAARK